MAKSLLTPKDLADAVGVSESSMRRWIDSGKIHMTRTAGGHRRIELAEALRFVRETGTPVVRGEILGVGEVVHHTRHQTCDDERLYEALAAGDRTLARGLVVSWYVAGRTLASIFDGSMRAALTRLGELWQRDRDGILVEHRATDICIDVIHHLRGQLPAPHERSAMAIGATPNDDWHSLPSQMAAAVAREGGMRDINYGPNAPLDLLAAEAKKYGARLVWLSITISPKRPTQAQVRELANALQAQKIELIVGGHFAGSLARQSHLRVLGSMSEFAALVHGLGNGARG